MTFHINPRLHTLVDIRTFKLNEAGEAWGWHLCIVDVLFCDDAMGFTIQISLLTLIIESLSFSYAPPIQKLNAKMEAGRQPEEGSPPQMSIFSEMIGGPAEHKDNLLLDSIYSFVHKYFPQRAIGPRGSLPPLHFKDGWNALPILKNKERYKTLMVGKHSDTNRPQSQPQLLLSRRTLCILYHGPCRGSSQERWYD